MERDPVVHRPASDEAMNRTVLVQTGFLTLVCWVWLAVLIFRGRVTGIEAILIVLLTVPFNYLLTRLVRGASATFAEKMIGGLSSVGNIKYQQGYSIQESLIARGQYDEAAASFRDHLTMHPDDVPARYRLATLHLRERNDPAAAEGELLNIRRRAPDRSTAMLVTNHLVDIYRATDQRGKLMAELTRMVKEWPGTPMADGAKKLLQELKEER